MFFKSVLLAVTWTSSASRLREENGCFSIRWGTQFAIISVIIIGFTSFFRYTNIISYGVGNVVVII
jgi:hypothetical protein